MSDIKLRLIQFKLLSYFYSFWISHHLDSMPLYRLFTLQKNAHIYISWYRTLYGLCFDTHVFVFAHSFRLIINIIDSFRWKANFMHTEIVFSFNRTVLFCFVLFFWFTNCDSLKTAEIIINKTYKKWMKTQLFFFFLNWRFLFTFLPLNSCFSWH